MKRRIFIFLIVLVTLSVFANYNSSQKSSTEYVSQITKYEINVPSAFDEYTMGFSPGLGSSLTFKEITEDGNIELYSITDRGPNYTIVGVNYTNNTIIFPKPAFSPFIGIITIVPDQSATLTHVISIKDDGHQITGLPITKPDSNSTLSIPTNSKYRRLSADPKGFDTESLDTDSEGNFWIGEEYRPSLIKVQATTGEITEIYSPGEGLPEILANGPYNRGFEALAVAPNGKIYASMESILTFNGDTKTSANFIRMIEFDPKTKKTRTFAYPYDKNKYLFPLTAKIGDMAAIDDTHFLLVEQGATSSGMRNLIYIIDISDVTDISNLTLPNTLPLEYASAQELSDIKFIKKSKVFDAVDHGWPHEKLEGVAIISSNTIAIANDNDFGFSISVNGVNSQDVTEYNVDYENQILLKNGKETTDKVEFSIQKTPTEIWIIEFRKNLLEFAN